MGMKLSLLCDQIELERLHIECFKQKLQKLETAQRNINVNKRRWNLDDIRNNIEVAFHTAWRIRLSQDVPEKQDYVASVAQIVEGLGRQYKAKKQTLGQIEVSAKDRKEQVFLFLQSILAKYESLEMSRNKNYALSKNLGNEDDFYCPLDAREQLTFDAFVLDQRT